MKRLFPLILLAVVILAAVPAYPAQISVYHSQSITRNINLALLHLKQYCELRSQGALRVEIVPEGRAGQDESLLQQVQAGIAPMACVSVSELASAFPELKLLQLPFLFETRKKLYNFLDGPFRQEFDGFINKGGVRALAWFEIGPRRWVSPEKPYAEPVDFRGAKVQVPDNEMALATVNALGGVSTAIPFADVALAQLFSQGDIDVSSSLLQQLAPEIGPDFKPAITLSQHVWDLAVLIISEPFWNSLTSDERNALDEAAFEAQMMSRGIAMDSDIDTLYKVQSAGAKLTPLTPERRQLFLLATQGVYDDLKNKVGQQFFESFMRATEGVAQKRLPGVIISTDLPKN